VTSPPPTTPPSRPERWLRRQWAALAPATGGTSGNERADWADVGDDVLARYSEPHRRYHTAEHLAEVLQTVRSLADPTDPGASFHLDSPDDYVAVVLAAWFHDAVYDPRSATNEDDSARLASDRLGAAGLDAALVDEVARLVRLTAGHTVAPGDDNGALLVDADLAILGARPARYDRYAADVRDEYGFVDDDAFRSGRRQVLETFLGLGSIYHCELMVVRCDENARRNLRRELTRLGSTTPSIG
jgi:predicted metal-dependent HD superfamily phosphohydrolase